ncbi:hypothetical protein HMPREF9136_0184, partial [Prevotella dentalis DSM 3688]
SDHARRPAQDHLGGAEQERLPLCVREGRGVKRVAFKRQQRVAWIQKTTTYRMGSKDNDKQQQTTLRHAINVVTRCFQLSLTHQ